MKKILIINGSPRKNGSTASLIKAFTSGALELQYSRSFNQQLDRLNWQG